MGIRPLDVPLVCDGEDGGKGRVWGEGVGRRGGVERRGGEGREVVSIEDRAHTHVAWCLPQRCSCHRLGCSGWPAPHLQQTWRQEHTSSECHRYPARGEDGGGVRGGGREGSEGGGHAKLLSQLTNW